MADVCDIASAVKRLASLITCKSCCTPEKEAEIDVTCTPWEYGLTHGQDLKRVVTAWSAVFKNSAQCSKKTQLHLPIFPPGKVASMCTQQVGGAHQYMTS